MTLFVLCIITILTFVCSPLLLDAEVKGLCGTYQRILMVPRPDYASRVILWRSMILKNRGCLTEALDLSSLAKITDGYTAGHISTIATSILSEYRVQQVCQRHSCLAIIFFLSSKMVEVNRVCMSKCCQSGRHACCNVSVSMDLTPLHSDLTNLYIPDWAHTCTLGSPQRVQTILQLAPHVSRCSIHVL